MQRRSLFIFNLLLSMLLCFASFGTLAVRNDIPEEYNRESNMEGLAGIPLEELEYFEANYNIAMTKIEHVQKLRRESMNTITIPISEHISMELELEEYERLDPNFERATRTTYTKLVTATKRFTNRISGISILTVASYGEFRYNGIGVTALDAWGDYEAHLYADVSVASNVGASSVRNSFSGKFSLSIEWLELPLQSFHVTNRITCNSKGIVTSAW